MLKVLVHVPSNVFLLFNSFKALYSIQKYKTTNSPYCGFP